MLGILSVAFFYRAAGCYIDLNSIPGIDPYAVQSGGSLTNVHFLDVGQGDSILIRGGDKNILIDGGERDQGEEVLADLAAYGVETLDCIIATHPHSDHIGGLVDVLTFAAESNDLKIKQVIIPEIPPEDTPTSAVYGKFLDGVEANGLAVTFAEHKMTLDLGDSILTLYPPVEGIEYSSLNDYSVCAHLVCGDVSFFFTGDMEMPEENDMLYYGALSGVEATVLKAGHHGSSTSSSHELLSQIDPEYVVISCGTGNRYGHPHDEAIERFEMYAQEVYRTDKDGTITCTTDGTTLTWSVEK